MGIQINRIRLEHRAYTTQLRDAASTKFCSYCIAIEHKSHEVIIQIDECGESGLEGSRVVLNVGLRVTFNVVTTSQKSDHHLDFLEFVHRELKRPFRLR